MPLLGCIGGGLIFRKFIRSMKAVLSLRPSRVLRLTLLSTVAINAISLATNLYAAAAFRGYLDIGTKFSKLIVYNLNGLFSTYREANIATFYSSLLLFVASALLFIAWKSPVEDLMRSHRWTWLFLSIVFLYMSFDEMLKFHERSLYLFYFVFALLGLSIIPFLRVIRPRFRKLFFLSGFLYLLGAVGFDRIEAFFRGSQTVEILEQKFWFILLYSSEEFLEMMGVAIFIYSVSLYISSKEVSIDFSGGNAILE